MKEPREQNWSENSLRAGFCDWCGRKIDADHDGWCPQTDAEIEAVGDAVEREMSS